MISITHHPNLRQGEPVVLAVSAKNNINPNSLAGLERILKGVHVHTQYVYEEYVYEEYVYEEYVHTVYVYEKYVYEE